MDDGCFCDFGDRPTVQHSERVRARNPLTLFKNKDLQVYRQNGLQAHHFGALLLGPESLSPQIQRGRPGVARQQQRAA